MKCERTETEIRLIAESDFERECLRIIAKKRGQIHFKDREWETGPLIIKIENDDWGR